MGNYLGRRHICSFNFRLSCSNYWVRLFTAINKWFVFEILTSIWFADKKLTTFTVFVFFKGKAEISRFWSVQRSLKTLQEMYLLSDTCQTSKYKRKECLLCVYFVRKRFVCHFRLHFIRWLFVIFRYRFLINMSKKVIKLFLKVLKCKAAN